MIEKATEEKLNQIYNDYFLSDVSNDQSTHTEANQELIKDLLNNMKRDPQSGRLILPALWRKEIDH